MKIFIQMSVGGFKIFDIQQFLHKEDDFCYAFMSEIASTHNGMHNYRTHIIKDDSHGIRVELMRLFSSNSISLLLQNDVCEERNVRCLYMANVGNTKDEINRSCDVSFCVMGENEEENKLVNHIAYALIVTNNDEKTNQIGELLHTKILGDKQVLAFDTTIWNGLCESLYKKDCSPKDNAYIDIVNENQLVVINGNLDFIKVYRENEKLFNDNPYIIINSKKLPLGKNSDNMTDMIKWEKSNLRFQGRDKVHGLFHEIINELKKIKL